MDVSLRRPINQLIRAENSTSVTTNRLISIGSGGGSGNSEPEVKVKEYVVLIGNRKWIQEKNFIEIPSDVEAKLTQQEALVSVLYTRLPLDNFDDVLFFCKITGLHGNFDGSGWSLNLCLCNW